MPEMSRSSSESEDDLFDRRPRRPTDYETLETVPIERIKDSPEQDTLVALPQSWDTQQIQTQNGASRARNPSSQYFTQSTQLIERGDSPPTDISSPIIKPVVQVAQSSPMAPTPTVQRKPTSILASAMAPAGTAFRKPVTHHDQKPDEAPVMFRAPIDSSDSDSSDGESNDIKPRTFVRKHSPVVPDSPQINASNGTFSSVMAGFSYDPNSHSANHKRSADTMAGSYGNVSKKPRQIQPSRALPVTKVQAVEPDLELDSIEDWTLRNHVRRMHSLCGESVRTCYEMILRKKGHFDDAMEAILELSERRDRQQRKAIDLTGSDDELMPTPAMNKTRPIPLPAPAASQVSKTKTQSIAQKYAGKQDAARKQQTQSRPLNVFEEPPPRDPAAAVKKRTLIRGRKDQSPGPSSQAQPEQAGKPHIVIPDDSDGEVDSAIHSEAEDTSFDDRMLVFFNTCTALDLADTAAITVELAEHVISKRPFPTAAALHRIRAPDQKPGSRALPLGERVYDKVYDMLKSYEAVDYLVKRCGEMARSLADKMKTWGIDGFNPGDNTAGLELTKIPSPSHDSGIGTPISDDDSYRTAASGRKAFIGQPSSMAENVVMKDYQIVGLNWLILLFQQRYSCILADDMGLGKTLQTIAFLAHLAEVGETGPHLIVVPTATLENWLKEFQRFCPGLSVEPYYGSMPEREDMRLRLDDHRDEVNVIVTTYTIARGKEDAPWLRQYGFTCAIFDEAHALKNPESEVARKLGRIRARFRLMLTGTPLQNNLKELMGLLSFLMPKLFLEKSEDMSAIFQQKVNTITGDASARELLLSKRRIERARTMLTPFILRRKKWQVLKELPKKDRFVHYCEMTQEQQNIYNGWLARAWDIRERKARGEKLGIHENANVLVKLREAAIHPLLFKYFYSDKKLSKIANTCPKIEDFAQSNPTLVLTELVEYADFEVHDLCRKHSLLHKYMLGKDEWEVSGKVHAMLKLLTEFRAGGHKTLIFSQFVMVLEILEQILTNHNIPYLRLDGSTKTEERQELVDLFNDPASEAQVFMLSTKAGGAGINLAGASRVIIFDSGFNPQDDIQAENRAHRIGQTKDVQVWRLVTKGTVEEQIYDMGLVKLKLDKEVAGEGAADLDEPRQAKGKKAGKADEGEILSKAEQEGVSKIEELLFEKLDEMPSTSPFKARKDDQKKLTFNKPADEDSSESESESELSELNDSEVEKIKPRAASKDNVSVDVPSRPRRAATKPAKSSSQQSTTEGKPSHRSRSGRTTQNSTLNDYWKR